MGYKMNKLTSIFLAILLTTGFVGTIEAAAPLGGLALKAQNQKQLELLEEKKAELKKNGGNVSEIEQLEVINKKLITINDQRHELHQATIAFAKAVEIFSGNLEENIQELNEVIAALADGAVNNAKIASLAQPKVAQKDNKETDEEE